MRKPHEDPSLSKVAFPQDEIKGLLHPKMKILSLITYPMSFQTRKRFDRLQNTI